jgi:outer membrane protein TolC
MNKRLRKNTGIRTLSAGALLLLTMGLQAQQNAQQASQNAQQASPVHLFSITQAIDYAAKNSVIVKNALLDYDIQEQSNRATTSQALPQVTGSAGFTQYIQVPVTPVPGGLFPGTVAGKVYPFPFGVTYNSNAAITLKQVLFDGQVFVGLQARRAALDFYRKKEEVTEQLLRVNIYKVYYQLLIARTQMIQVDANIDNQQAQLHSASEMFKNGFAEELDVDKASVQLANLETEKIQLQLGIDNGYLGLKVLMGMPVRDSLALTDSLTYDQIRNAALTDDYKYTDRRDFQLMMINKTLDEYNVKRYQKQYIPSLNFQATYQQNQYLEHLDLTAPNSW